MDRALRPRLKKLQLKFANIAIFPKALQLVKLVNFQTAFYEIKYVHPLSSNRH
jgi:hypothetical protein